VLKSLSEENLRAIIDRALVDPHRGLGLLAMDCADRIRDQLAREARGDARRALSALGFRGGHRAGRRGRKATHRRDHTGRGLQRKTLMYDKAGDEHYMVVSAFIKSMRGSDPDAAVYWMARMLEAGRRSDVCPCAEW
jgi:putative ATPase